MTIGNIYDLNFLLKLTNKLFENHTFDSYLTNQQLIVLNHILKHNELNSEIWPDFMSGNLRLKVKIDQTVEDKANQEQLQTTDGVAGSPKNTHIKKKTTLKPIQSMTTMNLRDRTMTRIFQNLI